MKLSKRLKEYREMLDLPSANELKTLLYDAELLARRVEQSMTSEALVAGWLAKAEILERQDCIESAVISRVLRECSGELVYPRGIPCLLVPVEGGS